MAKNHKIDQKPGYGKIVRNRHNHQNTVLQRINYTKAYAKKMHKVEIQTIIFYFKIIGNHKKV